ncbi:MAG: UDP-N-acetylglucosamine 2-epimerase (non-hydrolyzing) [Phycisphaerales bacterium]|nr:UDP-N-acetylglucosamine 2-epimerase (non-hydrolyzing) [Phycisphaerales bacterium]
MPRVTVVFGTRPEAIKMAPVVHRLRATNGIDCRVCVTGQHRQMLDQVLEVFDIAPDSDLNLMRPEQTLAGLTARAIEAVDVEFAQNPADMVLVQGDTTTVLATALAAFYRRVPVGHVEAGLRTFDLDHPWPEEANRVLTSRLTALHFCPTSVSRGNLLREGVSDERILVTGNTVIDALLMACDKIQAQPPAIPGLDPAIMASSRPLVLITGHRRENFGEGFEQICRSIAELARRYADTDFVYPVHLNPNVRRPVERILGTSGGDSSGERRRNIHLIEPLPYLPFVALMNRSTLILTDSGGVQEEAPSLGKPVLVMRDTTERPEAVDAGTVRLVGADFDRIVGEVSRLLEDDALRQRMSSVINPYGDGHAAERIADALERWFAASPQP